MLSGEYEPLPHHACRCRDLRLQILRRGRKAGAAQAGKTRREAVIYFAAPLAKAIYEKRWWSRGELNP